MYINPTTANFTFVLTETLQNAFPSGIQQEPLDINRGEVINSSLAWLASHLEQLKLQYPNSWILLADDHVIAASPDPTELERRAASEGIENPLITKISGEPIAWNTAYAG